MIVPKYKKDESRELQKLTDEFHKNGGGVIVIPTREFDDNGSRKVHFEDRLDSLIR